MYLKEISTSQGVLECHFHFQVLDISYRGNTNHQSLTLSTCRSLRKLRIQVSRINSIMLFCLQEANIFPFLTFDAIITHAFIMSFML